MGISGYRVPGHGDVWTKDGCQRFVSSHWRLPASKDAMQSFRRAAYTAAQWPLPRSWARETPPRLPRVIRFVWEMGEGGIENKDEVIKMLWEVALPLDWRVRPLGLTLMAPFASQLSSMAQTGLLVVRHGPLVANAIFLPPGAAVFELIPYNCEWAGMSEMYANMTQACGDLHHFAWTARDRKWAAYASEADGRYANWTSDECWAKECLVAHERAGMIVDVDAVRSALEVILPKVSEGASIERLRQPWPDAK
ncbi:unnamed protein product [Ostreobium quekettii]|uniref:Uncharacterized protein n=1 Tax=Ostreobium quekettii TaxID=121088 RepID=A0A8S1JAB0_9CHLO|nr:unnamed protein product [Ostreobium quekettii]|eukprot:evm.model.scf_2374.2 EVM.evm.TU.scf_2374.2   scf_2374:4232-7043(-)